MTVNLHIDKIASSGGCRGLCEERPGLPRAGHRWLQLAQTHPLQGTAGPLSQGGGDLGKMCLRKGKKTTGQSGKVNGVRNNRGNTRVRGEEVVRMPEQRFPCNQPLEETMVEQVSPCTTPQQGPCRTCSPGERPMPEEEKSVRRKGWQRGAVMD